MQTIHIGDEVYSRSTGVFARVSQVFPAAVCVRVGVLSHNSYMELISTPELWSADEIENLSVCRSCGSRDDLQHERDTGTPFRVCRECMAHQQFRRNRHSPPHNHEQPSASDQ